MSVDPGYDDEERLRAEGAEERRRLKAAARLVLLGIVTLVGATLLAFALTEAFGAAARFVVNYRKVPDVLANGVAAAREAAAREGFGVEIVAVYRGDPGEVATGTLEGQEPSPGTWGWRDEPIRIRVVSGPARVPVPDVTGVHAEQANIRLVKAGLGTVSFSRETTQPAEVNYHHAVVATIVPPPGELLERGKAPEVRFVTATDEPQPWLHQEAVKSQGAAPCLGCHDETYCSACHVRAAAGEPLIPSRPRPPIGLVDEYLGTLLEDNMRVRGADILQSDPVYVRGSGASGAIGLLAKSRFSSRSELLKFSRRVFGDAFYQRDGLQELTIEIYLPADKRIVRALSLTLTRTTADKLQWQNVSSAGLIDAVDKREIDPSWNDF